MAASLVLASQSEIRESLLRQAGVAIDIEPARIDEESVKSAMILDGATPRDIADSLAEAKAHKVAGRRPDALVLGCDQVLAFKGDLLSKPASQNDAILQLHRLRDGTHQLLSAAVLYDEGRPVWRHVGQVRLTMRQASDAYIEDYVSRNWDSIRHAVGCYKLEEEGVRLFTRIEGDYFHVLGLPLLELLSYLTLRGTLPG